MCSDCAKIICSRLDPLPLRFYREEVNNKLCFPELDLEDVADGLKWAFLVLPNYCLGQGISDIFNNYNTLRLVDQECHSKAKFLPLADCEKMAKEFLGPKLKFQTNYLAWDNPGIGRYLVFLALEGIVFYSLVLLIEYGAFSACARFFKRLRAFSANVIVSQESHSADDDDVLEEKERVMRSTDKDDVLVIRELSKVFYGNGRKFYFNLFFARKIIFCKT